MAEQNCSPRNDSRPVSVEQLAQFPIETMPADLRNGLYRDVFERAGKRTLFCLHLLFVGETERPAEDGYLPFRLSAAQREEARAAFATLFHIVKTAKLERTAISKAKADVGFQRFMGSAASASEKRRRGRRG